MSTETTSERSSERGEGRLRVVVANTLPDELAKRIVEREPRIDLVREPELLPPMRHPADFAGDPEWHRTYDQQRRFEELLQSADALYGVPDLSPELLKKTVENNEKLRWVHTMAAGGGASVKAAQLSKHDLDRVTFTTSAGVHGNSLAEFAVFGLLAGAKTLPRLQRQQRAHEWTLRWTMKQLSDMTVLVLGYGGIGKVLAQQLKGLGATVWATAREHKPADGTVERFVTTEELAAIAPEVDALANTLPGTEATEGLVDDAVFAALPDGALVTNVGRGSVFDEDALIKHLQSGHLGFAALDVFAHEPLAEDSPLWDMENVLVSPHTAALTDQEETRIADLFTQNATALLDGRPLANVVDTVEFY